MTAELTRMAPERNRRRVAPRRPLADAPGNDAQVVSGKQAERQAVLAGFIIKFTGSTLHPPFGHVDCKFLQFGFSGKSPLKLSAGQISLQPRNSPLRVT